METVRFVSMYSENSVCCRNPLLPLAIVLGMLLAAVISFSRSAWLGGKTIFSIAGVYAAQQHSPYAGPIRYQAHGIPYACEAHGGADRLLQLGNLDDFQHQIYSGSDLCQQLFNVVSL